MYSLIIAELFALAFIVIMAAAAYQEFSVLET